MKQNTKFRNTKFKFAMKRMTISEETKLLNLTIYILKSENLLKKAIIEYKMDLNDGSKINPDFFAYLIREPDFNNYLLLEFKQRTVTSPEDINKIKSQYNGYCKIDYNNLDATIIPIDQTAPIFINYIFFDTPNSLIKNIDNEVNFNENVGILYYQTSGANKRRIKYSKTPSDPQNQLLNELLIKKSLIVRFWENYLIPFTAKDLEGISGSGGSPSAVNIDTNVSISIILSNLCTFILQRKIQNLSSEFNSEIFFDYIFSNLIGITKFDDESKKNITKKLTLFLNLVDQLCKDEKFAFISKRNKSSREYLITIRNTDNLVRRIENIREKLCNLLKTLQLQRKLDEFI